MTCKGIAGELYDHEEPETPHQVNEYVFEGCIRDMDHQIDARTQRPQVAEQASPWR